MQNNNLDGGLGVAIRCSARRGKREERSGWATYAMRVEVEPTKSDREPQWRISARAVVPSSNYIPRLLTNRHRLLNSVFCGIK